MIKKLGIVANCGKPDALAVLKKLSAKAKKLGIELVSDKGSLWRPEHGRQICISSRVKSVDAVMALGGDGTMLRAVRMLEGRDIPLIGLNLGALGFLTSVVEDELDRALKSLVTGKYLTSVRAMLDAVVERKGRILAKQRALNDVVVSSGPSNRVVVLGLSIDGDKVTSYVCDGLIVSTPTGSTGHSLSSGGPILTPETQAFVISLICPHTLSSRPLVVPDKSEIIVSVEDASGKILFSVDGQIAHNLHEGDKVKIQRSRTSVRFIHLPGHSYFTVLRKKLHWSGSNV
ncbi:MAG: NAD(+)/NADH kinase [Kiritimatiellae bacterium]|nr:NAD(+)/NADH kinase [Kiritimatiellia bacterium]MDD5520657.1 NAD(+)/NADH kinase [Kiritimatiellia bacterium]